jgi:hypothetical protein
MRDDGGIRFESLRLYLELPQSLLSGLFVLRVLQIYTDNGIRMNMRVQSLRD